MITRAISDGRNIFAILVINFQKFTETSSDVRAALRGSVHRKRDECGERSRHGVSLSPRDTARDTALMLMRGAHRVGRETGRTDTQCRR